MRFTVLSIILTLKRYKTRPTPSINNHETGDSSRTFSATGGESFIRKVDNSQEMF